MEFSVHSGDLNIRLCVIYRLPPSKSNGFRNTVFFEEWESYLDQNTILVPAHNVLFTGDFNFHLDNLSDPDALRFHQSLKDRNLTQHVKDVTHDRGNILDLIITNKDSQILNGVPNVRRPNISDAQGNLAYDHFSVHATLTCQKPKSMRKDISLRKCKEIDMTAFKKDIVDCFSCTGIDSSVEQQVEHYRGNLSNIFDKHAPVTIKSVVLRPNTEWYSDDLNNAKRDKRKAERKWRDSKLEVHHQIFKEKCRTFGKLLYIDKETYYSSKIENCGNDHKQLFKLTKHLMGKQQQTPLPSSSSDLELSNSFADFFVNKVVTIRDGLRDQNEDVETRRALLYSEVEELFKDHEGRNHLVLDKQIFVNATDKDDQEIESLKKAITELTFDHPCWGEKMPNACVPLELEIAEMVAAGKQILSLVELEELNSISKVSVLDLEQLHDFLHFQHSLGKIIYFDTLQLRDYVIINPLLMVEVMRSFVTDIGFWPKKRRMQVIFSRMSESGIIHREDLYKIWEQKDFRPILPYKEFIFNILIHLDILAEQRRYDTGTGSRKPVENFFVPCMVTERNTTSFMEKECTPEKAICLAFVFKGTVIPPALPNRLISACLSMWTLKQYEGKKLLFSGFIVVSFDKAHDVVVCVEGNKILLYIVHKSSAGLIVPDVATGVKECLVTTMERISDFYQSTIHEKHIQQLPFQIEYSCSALKCFISEEEGCAIQ
ncbi:unnamed protein product [Mytilus edulis]|uniref:COR domain-containing protein n=1 Tax=Mytilus edulis TaxID=6550 RepID=A0A8S3SG60_MYTED|nr:unnamed protein product [Mytilus edulis]